MVSNTAWRIAVIFWGSCVAIHEGLFVLIRFGGCELVGSLTPKAALLTMPLRPQGSMRPRKVTGSGLGYGMTGGCHFGWGFCVEIHYAAFVSGQFAGCELVGSLTPKAALLTVLLQPQVSKRPMELTGSGPGYGKAGGCHFGWSCWVAIHDGLFV